MPLQQPLSQSGRGPLEASLNDIKKKTQQEQLLASVEQRQTGKVLCPALHAHDQRPTAAKLVSGQKSPGRTVSSRLHTGNVVDSHMEDTGVLMPADEDSLHARTCRCTRMLQNICSRIW